MLPAPARPDGTGLAVLVPMLGRAHRVAPLVASICATVPAASVLFLLSDRDEEVIQAVGEVGCRRLILPRSVVGDYANKINTGVRHTTEPLLFTAADDLCFHPGWFAAALAWLQPGIGVVGTNDLGSPRVMAGQHSTHFLVTRAYAERGTADGRVGQLMCPEYPHEYVDDELVETAKQRQAWAMALDSHVEHLHPNWGKAPMDALYQQQQARMRRGKIIYLRRRHLWT